MKPALLVSALTAAVAVAVAATPATAAPSAGAPPCIAKIAKIKGKTAAENCGPATVAVTVAGKSYHFKNGLCTSSGGTFLLDLGTIVAVDHAHNLGLPNVDLIISGHSADVTGMYGGKSIIPDGMALASVKNPGKNTGTFSSSAAPKMTGSWSCHGVIFKS
ncbi:MAG: hypothetical protein ABI317_06985 [Gaiellales bacterium]